MACSSQQQCKLGRLRHITCSFFGTTTASHVAATTISGGHDCCFDTKPKLLPRAWHACSQARECLVGCLLVGSTPRLLEARVLVARLCDCSIHLTLMLCCIIREWAGGQVAQQRTSRRCRIPTGRGSGEAPRACRRGAGAGRRRAPPLQAPTRAFRAARRSAMEIVRPWLQVRHGKSGRARPWTPRSGG